MDADGNLYTTHLGTDLFKRETDGATFRWGVLAGFADGDFDVSSNVDGKSSKGSFRGYSAGLYMTAESKAESGPFLGLQLRWNRFDSEVGQDDYDVNGLSLTAEASWISSSPRALPTAVATTNGVWNRTFVRTGRTSAIRTIGPRAWAKPTRPTLTTACWCVWVPHEDPDDIGYGSCLAGLC